MSDDGKVQIEALPFRYFKVSTGEICYLQRRRGPGSTVEWFSGHTGRARVSPAEAEKFVNLGFAKVVKDRR